MHVCTYGAINKFIIIIINNCLKKRTTTSPATGFGIYMTYYYATGQYNVKRYAVQKPVYLNYLTNVIVNKYFSHVVS